MIKTVSEADFRLVEIPKEDHKDFTAIDRLAVMQSFLLRTIGDALRDKGTEEFWIGGNYCWWVKKPEEGICLEYHVFMTDKSAVIFEDCESEKMYVVLES